MAQRKAKRESEVVVLRRAVEAAKKAQREAEAKEAEAKRLDHLADLAGRHHRKLAERAERPLRQKAARIRKAVGYSWRYGDDVRKAERLLQGAERRQRVRDERKRILALGRAS